MKMIIEFDMDNAAFDNNGFEVGRILTEIAQKSLDGVEADFSGNIKDFNGNTVGQYYVELTAQEYQDSLDTDTVSSTDYEQQQSDDRNFTE